jgi:hypothetical protein
MTFKEQSVLGLIILLCVGMFVGFIFLIRHSDAKARDRNDLMMRYCIEAGGDPVDCACDAYHGGICGYVE